MSNVHDDIALKAFAVLPESMRKEFEIYAEDINKASWYPDIFADRTMSKKQRDLIDPEADRFIYPDPPQDKVYKKILEITEKEQEISVSPLRSVYLVKHYLERILESLAVDKKKDAMKFAAVFSHVIGDSGEPVHALNPRIIDLVVPPPEKFMGMELHANIEKLGAKVCIASYKPVLLGKNKTQIIMGTYAGLCKVRDTGLSLAVPITQALYAGKRKEALRLSAIAQSASSKLFADFMYSVLTLFKRGENSGKASLDLRRYPFVSCDMDMLYRYRPMVDISLIPYSNGKSHPLSLNTADGIKRVRGIGMVGLMAPPYSESRIREASVEYYLEPGAFSTFSARVGLNPLFTDSICGTEFIVFGDGRKIAHSPEVKPGGQALEISASVKNVRWLKLLIRYTNNPSYEDVQRLHCAWASHAVWAEPKLR